MIQLRNILVPVDFSRPSENAFAYALSLAVRFRAQITVAHVVGQLDGFEFTLPNGVGDPEKLSNDSARRALQDFVQSRAGAGSGTQVPVRTVLKSGDVRDELLRIVDEEKIDLVALGTHGRRSIERFILGSTTEHLLRKLPVPILTVPLMEDSTETGNSELIPIRRIVYATDLSANAEIGLRYAAEVAGLPPNTKY